MATKIATPRLTAQQRLRRGLHYTAVGPVDLTRGALGVGAGGVRSAAATARRQYRAGRLSSELSRAQAVLADLPESLTDGRRQRRRRRAWVFGGIAAAVAGGAVAFSVIRRSTQRDPSGLPPSVDIEPRP